MSAIRINKYLLSASLLLTVIAARHAAAEGSAERAKQFPQISVSPEENRNNREPVTLCGFFPSPPKVTVRSILRHYKVLGNHADVILYQMEIPWEDFPDSPEAESEKIQELRGQMMLADREGLEKIFVIDPLNGLNRREFKNLPPSWEASFADPRVRASYKNFALRILREFKPAYLGLASEINSYQDAYPEDFPNYLNLYHEVYASLKAESPDINLFVTFQWEDLNNLWNQPEEEGFAPGVTKWNQIELFEPDLDLWAISTYPYITFSSGEDIPADYYSRLLERTDKPLAVSEGGWISKDYGHLTATPQDQTAYLEAIHNQIGERLAFWIYLLARDISIESYRALTSERDLETLRFFTTVGLITEAGRPKPALKVWDSYRR